MKTWHYRRIKINAPHHHNDGPLPKRAPAGNWVFFFISWMHDATKTPFRQTYTAMHTLGLDGVE